MSEDGKSKFREVMSRRKIQSRFSKKRVDYTKVLKDFYIEDGLAYISVNVRDYYDVIDRYSVREYEWPNADFLRFVDDNAYYIPSEYPIVLEISGTRFTEKQQAVIIETLKDYYALELGDKQLDIRDIRRKEIVMVVFTILSAIVLLLYAMAGHHEGLLHETLLIIFWFFLWELGDIVAFDSVNAQRKKTDAAQLASMKIIFSERFTDEPVDETLKEEIMEEIIDEIRLN